jgi:Rrf2 family protein
MQLTRESEHALVGLGFLATKPMGTTVPLAEIAETRGLPAPFLAKTFQKLASHDIVASTRGRRNGYALARPADSINVLEVLVAVEGPRLLNRCTLWQSHCSDEDPCPLHPFLKDRVPVLEDRLREVSIADLVRGHARVV